MAMVMDAAGLNADGPPLAVGIEIEGSRLSGFAFLGGRFDSLCLGYARFCIEQLNSFFERDAICLVLVGDGSVYLAVLDIRSIAAAADRDLLFVSGMFSEDAQGLCMGRSATLCLYASGAFSLFELKADLAVTLANQVSREGPAFLGNELP